MLHRSAFDELPESSWGIGVLDAAWEVQEQASEEGFDWPAVDGVLDKIAEELEEIRAALRDQDREQAQRELGDLLLASVNLGRFLAIHPGEALGGALARFEQRYARLKEALADDGKLPGACSLDELDAVWASVKTKGLRRQEEEA